jgi:hypothetical protein
MERGSLRRQTVCKGIVTVMKVGIRVVEPTCVRRELALSRRTGIS